MTNLLRTSIVCIALSATLFVLGSTLVGAGTLTVIHSFATDGTDGTSVRGSLVQIGARLYGLAGERGPNQAPPDSNGPCNSSANWQNPVHLYECPGTLFSLALDGTGFRVEHAFTRIDQPGLPLGHNVDGYHPYSSLAVTSDGLLHGVTQLGGANGAGVLFTYNPTTQVFTVNHNFCSMGNCLDGRSPMGSLAVFSDGRLAGTTTKGGNTNGDGTVFVWDPSTSTFTSAMLDAAGPGKGATGGLTAGPPGLPAVGMTYAGGLQNRGAVITVDPGPPGNLPWISAVATFPNFVDSQYGQGNPAMQVPVVTSGGQILLSREYAGQFGTGELGYAGVGGSAGSPVNVLFEFQNVTPFSGPRFQNTTGAFPNGQLATFSPTGTLYGTTMYGGAWGLGTIYSWNRFTNEFVLYSFQLVQGLPGTGTSPYGGLLAGSDGALYGTTFVGTFSNGQVIGTGTVFRFTL